MASISSWTAGAALRSRRPAAALSESEAATPAPAPAASSAAAELPRRDDSLDSVESTGATHRSEAVKPVSQSGDRVCDGPGLFFCRRLLSNHLTSASHCCGRRLNASILHALSRALPLRAHHQHAMEASETDGHAWDCTKRHWQTLADLLLAERVASALASSLAICFLRNTSALA